MLFQSKNMLFAVISEEMVLVEWYIMKILFLLPFSKFLKGK